MARLIEVENRLFEFPDDTPDEVIKSTIQREFAPPSFGDVVKAGAVGGVSALQRHAGGALQFVGDVGEKIGIPGAESVTAAGKGIRESADINQELATPENMTYWQKAGSGALSSVIAASPYVIGGLGMGGVRAIGAAGAGMAPKAAAAAGAARAANVGIGTMSAGEGLRKYGEVRDAGFGIGRSLVHGTAEAGAEFLGEKIPVTNALKVLGAKGFLKALGTFIGQDLVGEQFTTAAEWLNAKLSNRPNATVDELIEDAKLTFGATLLTGPLQAGVVLPARVAVDKLVNPRIEAAATALPERTPMLPSYGATIPPEAIGFEMQSPLYPDDVIVTDEAVARSKRRMPTAQVLTEGGFVPEDLIANPPAEMPTDLKMSRLASLVQKGAFRTAEEQTEMTQLRRTLTAEAILNPDARLLVAESAAPGEQQLTGDILIGQAWRKRTTQRHNRLKKLVGMEGAPPPAVSTPLVEAPPAAPGMSAPTVEENAAAFGVPPERTRTEFLPSQISEGSFTSAVVDRGNWVNPATNQTLINEVDALEPGVTLYSQSDNPATQTKITQLHRITQAWAKMFMPGAKIALRMNPGPTGDDASGRFGALGPKTFALEFDIGRSNADSFITLSHEFGHGIAYATLESASQEEHEQLLDAYYTSLEKGRAQSFREFAKDWFGPKRYRQLVTWAESSGNADKPAEQVLATLEDVIGRKGYIGSFDEWFAEQTVRYVYDRKGVVPEARGFFAKVVASLKAFFARFGDKFAPNQTFAEWLDNLAVRNAGEVDLQAKEKGDKALRLQLRQLGYEQAVIDSLTDEVTGFDSKAARELIESTKVPKKYRTEVSEINIPDLEEVGVTDLGNPNELRLFPLKGNKAAFFKNPTFTSWLLQAGQPTIIVDAFSGTGAYANALKQLFAGVPVVRSDLNKSRVEVMKRLPSATFQANVAKYAALADAGKLSSEDVATDAAAYFVGQHMGYKNSDVSQGQSLLKRPQSPMQTRLEKGELGRRAKLVAGDKILLADGWETADAYAAPGALIVIDPNYETPEGTIRRSEYRGEEKGRNLTLDEQATKLAELVRKGAKVVYHNADHPHVREMLKQVGFEVKDVNVSHKGQTRKEVVAFSYPLHEKQALQVQLQMATFRMAEYTTKVIEQLPKKPLVKRQTIEDLLRQASIRDVERERLQAVLMSFSGEMIDRASFAHAVAQDALELGRITSSQWASYGLEEIVGQRVGRMWGWSEPTTVIFYTPGITHTYTNHFDNNQYFAHIREVANYNDHSMYVYEIQSDLFAHMRQAEENPHTRATLDRLRAVQQAIEIVQIAHSDVTQLELSVQEAEGHQYAEADPLAIAEIYKQGVKNVLTYVATTFGANIAESMERHAISRADALMAIYQRDGTATTADHYNLAMLNAVDQELRRMELEVHDDMQMNSSGRFYRPEKGDVVQRYEKTWFERLIREEVRVAAEEGLEKVRVATADTVAKVEGWRKKYSDQEVVIPELKGLQVDELDFTSINQFETGVATGKVIVYSGRPQLVVTLTGRQPVETAWVDLLTLAETSPERSRLKSLALSKLKVDYGRNQGIYNRYKTEVEKFLKREYKAREVTVNFHGDTAEVIDSSIPFGALGYGVRSTWLEFDITPAMATDPVVLYDLPLWSRLTNASEELGALSGVTSFPEDTVRFNNVVRYGLGAFQMIKLNEHVPGTVAFRDGLRNKMRYKAEWLHQANDIVDEWVYQMPKTEAAKLSRLLLDESRAGDLAKTDADRAAAWFSERTNDPEIPGRYVFRLRADVIKQYSLSDQAVELYSKIRSMFYESLDHMERLGVLELVRTYIPMVEARSAVQEAVRNRLSVGEVIMVAEAYAQENPEVHEQLTNALENLHTQFEALRKKPYTPYTRFGQWAIRVRARKDGVWRGKNVSPGDVIYMEQFEKKLDMQKELDSIKKEFEGTEVDPVVVPTYIPDVVYAFGGLPPAILDAMKSRLDLSEEQLREFKEILSDLTSANSFAKRMKHRRGVEGYTEDAARSFTDYFMRFANNVSKTQAMPELDDALTQLKNYARRLEATQNGNAVNAWRLYEWLFQTKEYLKNPGSELSELKSFVSLFYLGANVSSATLNAVQVPLVTGPYLSERYGITATFNALQKAYVDVFRSWKDLGKLTPDEQAMIERGLSDEFLNESFATELAQIAEGGALTRVQPVTFGRRILNKMNHYAMLPFKVIEEANRRVTALATYRLARKAGFSGAFDAEAYAKAREAVEDTQNVYAIENRPVFMRGNKSVVFQFMHYSQNMIFQSLGGDDSWKRLLLAQLMVAGVMGLPFATDLKDIAKFLGRKWFGVDFDAEYEARKFLDEIGVDHTLVMNGLTADVFGFDVSRRVSLGQVIPGVEAMGSHREFNKALLDAVGDVGGAGVAILFNALKFVSSEDPSLYKQLQHLAPSAIRNVMKSVDAAEKGGVTARNNAMLAETEWLQNAGIALGFQPKVVGDAFRVMNVQSEIAAYWIKRREVLIEEWHHVREVRGNDPEGRADVMTRIRKYNSEVPDPKLKIGGDTLARSAKARRKSQRQQERGLGTQRQLKRSAAEVSAVFSDEED